MTRDLILAVDQGTSSTKALVVTAGGEILASASEHVQTRYTDAGWAEQDPEALHESVVKAARAVTAKLEQECGVPRSQIACAGIANQRETFVLWDSEGEPVYPAVVWQCKRSTDICEELSGRGVSALRTIRERSGLIIDPYFSGTKVTWLLRNVPAISKAHQQGRLMFGTIDSWLLYRLTGGAVHATDMTNASRTLLFNIHTQSWDAELQKLLEAEKLILPEVKTSAGDFGTTDFGGAFESPVPITAMIGDSHSAFFGERCYTPGTAKATLGTGSSVLINAGSSAPPPHASSMSTIGFAIPGRVDYALEGIIVSAGAILNWLEQELALFSGSAELESLAQSVESAGGVTVIPGHAGLGAPFWRMDAKGSLHGLTFGTKKGHIVRAALESIPYQIRAILDAVREESGTECASIRADGGISRNGIVTSSLADCLGVPVHTFQTPDVTALGAAFLAGIGANVYSSVEEIAALEMDEQIVPPGTRADEAKVGYDRWLETVKRAWG